MNPERQPRVSRLGVVYPTARAEVIHAVDRLNLALDVWDVATMVEAFAEDGEVLHP